MKQRLKEAVAAARHAMENQFPSGREFDMCAIRAEHLSKLVNAVFNLQANISRLVSMKSKDHLLICEDCRSYAKGVTLVDTPFTFGTCHVCGKFARSLYILTRVHVLGYIEHIKSLTLTKVL